MRQSSTRPEHRVQWWDFLDLRSLSDRLNSHLMVSPPECAQFVSLRCGQCPSVFRAHSYLIVSPMTSLTYTVLILYGHIKTAEQRTIIQQYGDWYTIHTPLMGGLLHLVQRGGAWAGWGPRPVPSSLYHM